MDWTLCLISLSPSLSLLPSLTHSHSPSLLPSLSLPLSLTLTLSHTHSLSLSPSLSPFFASLYLNTLPNLCPSLRPPQTSTSAALAATQFSPSCCSSGTPKPQTAAPLRVYAGVLVFLRGGWLERRVLTYLCVWVGAWSEPFLRGHDPVCHFSLFVTVPVVCPPLSIPDKPGGPGGVRACVPHGGHG